MKIYNHLIVHVNGMLRNLGKLITLNFVGLIAQPVWSQDMLRDQSSHAVASGRQRGVVSNVFSNQLKEGVPLSQLISRLLSKYNVSYVELRQTALGAPYESQV